MKTIIKLAVFSLAMLTGWSPLPCAAQTSATASALLKANELYKEKNYAQAEILYQGLIDNGFQNGHLYYNLGNTHIRLGNTGKAILNYLRAQKFLPRDQDLQANLKYALQDTVDLIEWKRSGLLATFLFWTDDFNLTEHIQALVAINLLFWLSMCAWLYRRNATLDLIRKTMLAILLLIVVSTMVKWNLATSHKYGVVLAKKIDVKSGMDNNNVTLFQLHEGAVVSIEKEDAGWFKIKLNDGKSGWAKKNAIGA